MRLISIDQLEPGMRLGRTVYGADGRVLVAKGTTARAGFSRRLRELGITLVYIDDGSGVEAEDVVSPRSRLEAITVVRDVMVQARAEASEARNRKISAVGNPRLRTVVSRLLDELLSNRLAVVNLADIRVLDAYTFSHSVNVAVLSMMTGMAMGYDVGRLRDLGLGALLHDIGKTMVQVDLVRGSQHFSSDEFEQMKRHTEYGFDILRRQPELSLRIAHVAYQHHERIDGSGYPRGLAGSDIHELARIVAVADVYDALTAERPYRRAFMPHEAVELILGSAGHLFDFDISQAFLQNIALYPVGTEVELTTGEVGIVVRVDRSAVSRPVVRVFGDAEGNPIPPREVPLVDHPSILIRRVAGQSDDESARRVRGTSLHALEAERR